MGKWRYGSIHFNLGIGWEMSGRSASRPSRFISSKTVPCTHKQSPVHTNSPLYTQTVPCTHEQSPVHTNSPLYTQTVPCTHELRKQSRQQSLSGRFGKDRHLPLPRIETRCLYCRLTARSLIAITTELYRSLLNKIPQIQKMDKIMETLDNIGIKLFVLAALKEHQLCTFRYSFVYLHCVVPVLMH